MLSRKSREVSITLATRLQSLPQVTIAVPADGPMEDAAVKKLARLTVSVQNTSSVTGFLHAALVRVGKKYFLLAGPSGIGKSSYAAHLGAAFDAEVVASDWVAIEREDRRYYASDLNFAQSIRHRKRCLLTGIIFLTNNRMLDRDAATPNDVEFQGLLRETFDTATKQQLAKLDSFWLHNKEQLPFCCALPARRKPEMYIAQTLEHLVRKASAKSAPMSVGVVGTGAIGSELAFQLGQLPFVDTVHLFNRSTDTAKGFALDMNHGAASDTSAHTFVAHTTAKEVFEQASVVFLTFRDETIPPQADLPERWRKLPGHLAAIKEYAQLAEETQFGGTIFVVTNPVDILTYALYAHSQKGRHPLRTYQVYGVGLEVDAARALAYGKEIHPGLTMQDITLYGNHTDSFALKTPLPAASHRELAEAVKGASTEVRKYVPRTVYGPVAAIVKTFTAYAQNLPVHATILQENAHMGRKVYFKHGLPKVGLPPDDLQYATILQDNQEAIANYKHLM